MAEPIVRIDSISKSFGAFKVLDGLSMQVMPGEKLALIGPSGSGKTTILRILMTLERIDGGHIEVEGEQLYHMERGGKLVPADERHLARMRQKIGMVFQLFNLFPHKCVLDNVTLAPMLTKGVPKAQAQKRAMELLDMVGAARPSLMSAEVAGCVPPGREPSRQLPMFTFANEAMLWEEGLLPYIQMGTSMSPVLTRRDA